MNPQAPEIAALDDFTELSKEMIAQAMWAESQGYVAFPNLLMRAHAKLLEYKRLLDKAFTPLPIAPQETMREEYYIEREDMDTGEIVYHVWQRKPNVNWLCSIRESDHKNAKQLADKIVAALGQSHSPATVERELVEALRPFFESAERFNAEFRDRIDKALAAREAQKGKGNE